MAPRRRVRLVARTSSAWASASASVKVADWAWRVIALKYDRRRGQASRTDCRRRASVLRRAERELGHFAVGGELDGPVVVGAVWRRWRAGRSHVVQPALSMMTVRSISQVAHAGQPRYGVDAIHLGRELGVQLVGHGRIVGLLARCATARRWCMNLLRLPPHAPVPGWDRPCWDRHRSPQLCRAPVRGWWSGRGRSAAIRPDASEDWGEEKGR